MNRRILLIDADPDFRAHFVEQFGRYRFDIVVEPDPDEAIANATLAGQLPSLILLAVDEPDKVGFKVFQKIKKGPLAKTPIVLATKSVTPENIAKHRALKTHADEYVDKRTMGHDELLGKIDNLIGLGEVVADDDLDIPVEVDDIPLSEGDMVLEESVGEDDGTVATATDERMDRIVSAETDAAFDALMGGFGDELVSMAPAAEAATDHDRHDRSTTPPGGDPEPIQIADPEVVEPSLDQVTTLESAVPGIVMDGKRLELEDAAGFDTFSQESMRPPIDGHPLELMSKDTIAVDELAAQVVPNSEPALIVNRRFESSPAIEIDADDLQPIEEDSGGVPEPVPHLNVREPEVEPPLPVAVPPILPEVARPRFVDAPTMVAEARGMMAPAVVDLGLDAIAADAESEQSGVYDRRSLRKIGELERQISQLKTELDRQRASSSDISTRGTREREFVGLREQIITKDSQLKRTTADLDMRTRELADAEERLRQIQQTRMALEAKSVELEQRAAADGTKVSSLETRERTLAAQLAAVQHELDGKTQHLAAAETTRAQLDRDLATERATRAASASDAERALRVEREQMIARHQGELGSLRQEHAASVASAIEKQRQEHAVAQAAAVEAVRHELGAALDVSRQHLEAQRQQQAAELEASRQQLDGLRQQQAAELEASRQQLDGLRQQQAAELETSRQQVEQLRQQQAAELETSHQQVEQLRQQQAGELETSRQQVEQLRQQQATLETSRQQLDELRQQQAAALEIARQQVDVLRQQHAAALEAQHQELSIQLATAVEATRAEIATESDQAVTHLEAQHAADIARLDDEHLAALAKLAGERDTAIARGARERDEALARGARERDEAIGRGRSEQASTVERMQQEHAAAIRALQADHADAQEQYAATLARMEGDHGAELAHVREDLGGQVVASATAHDRVVAEITGKLEHTQVELASVRTAHAAALAQLAKQHAAELATQANQHAAAMTERERELAEARQDEAIAHTAALAELKVELDRQAATHGSKLDGARKELDEVIALHENAKSQLLEDQQRVAAQQATAHADELAKLAQDKQRAIDDIQRTQAEHRSALERVAVQHREELAQQKELADREVAEYRTALLAAKRTMEETAARHQAEREASDQAHAQALAEHKALHERAMAVANGEVVKVKALGDAEHHRAMVAKEADHEKQRKDSAAELARVSKELTAERDELQRGLSAARDTIKRSESELASAVQTIADRNAELRSHTAAIAERDQRLAELRREIESIETENSSYQEQVLRAYQKIKADEAMVARAKKAMAIALTVLDDQGNPKAET